MVNSGCRGFFAVKTGRLSSQNNPAHLFVMSVIFSTFYMFHNKIVMFFLPFGLASGREIRRWCMAVVSSCREMLG